jgi:hypothetical protein
MPPHALAAILTQPLDLAHSAVALLIGVAGGCILAELRFEPLRRALARRPKPSIDQDAGHHGGPWG